eukprot:COSAG05_NODE_1098_length_5892_cov_50.569480_4_plen_159_part_00
MSFFSATPTRSPAATPGGANDSRAYKYLATTPSQAFASVGATEQHSALPGLGGGGDFAASAALQQLHLHERAASAPSLGGDADTVQLGEAVAVHLHGEKNGGVVCAILPHKALVLKPGDGRPVRTIRLALGAKTVDHPPYPPLISILVAPSISTGYPR